jgi:hypothetical protein
MSVVGNSGSQVVSGGPEHFRAIMHTKSSRFWVGVQALTTDVHSSRCRFPVHLSVFGHGVGTIKLEQRKATSSTWTEVALNKVDATHWKVTRHPCVSMNYRVRSGEAAGPMAHVDVSPNVAFDARQHANGLTGKVNPLLTGQTVTVQKKTSSGWKGVATATLQADGSFKAVFNVTNGFYRAKVVPSASTGLVTGYSPKLKVVLG